MESVDLEKGVVHFLDDRIVVENDNAMVRKRKNILYYSLFVALFTVYAYYSYQQYQENPHEFGAFDPLVKLLFFVLVILPGIINNVVRFSTTDDIPYASIKKLESHGTLFNWNGGIKLVLPNNKFRTLWLDKEEMKKFRSLLDQKLMAYSPGL